MRRLLVCVGLLGLLSSPVLAQKAVETKAAAAADDDDDEDDILAPVRGAGEKPASTVPVKERALKVGVLPIVPLGDAGKPIADQLTAELTKALNESPSVEFVALALKGKDGAVAIDPAVAEGALKEAKASLERSAGLLKKLQFGKAKSSYEKTLLLLEQAAPALEGPELVIEAWVGLAEIAARQARDDETSRCLAFVVGLNPEFELDQKKYPGLFVTQHRKTRDRLLDGDKSAIVVDASAAGARVTIDGRPVAAAPAKAKGLYPGAHVVRVLREGLPPWGVIVTVEPGAEVTVSPGFFDPKRRGPGDDLAQNRFSAASATVVAEAAAAQGLAGAVVGVLAKAGGTRVATQLLYVDAKGRGVATLPDFKLQGDLLDIGIEVLKARARTEQLAGEATPTLAPADESEALIEGANAGAAVALSEVAMRFEVKRSGNLAVNTRVGDDDEDEGDERKVVENKTGTRRTLEEKKNRLSDTPTLDEDAPFSEQPWFLPTVIGASVIGVAAIAAGTGVALVAFKVIPDPRPASGAQISVKLPEP